MSVSANSDACVIGANFGTLSGRELVVRVRDGAELGTAVHEYRHAVMDDTLAAAGEPLPPDWALQLTGAETRNACTAGYKGIRQDGRYPSREYLAALRKRAAASPAARR